jgi:hypothetical protein
MVTLTATGVATGLVAGSTTHHGPMATAVVLESGHTKMEMGTVTCTKVLRWARVIQPRLCIFDLPYRNSITLTTDGVGAGRTYGRSDGEGGGYGPYRWDPYGDGWNYGHGNGRGTSSGYGSLDGSND